MIIIGILGEKLAGKDTVADYLVQKYGADHVRTSHILDELLNVLGLPITRRNEIDAGKGMEMVFGDRVIGQALISRIKKSTAPIVINNGLRQKYQFDDARAMGARIIYVTAPADLRYRRSLQKSQGVKDKGQQLAQFIEQEKEWIEAEVPKLGAQADFKIDNTGSIHELFVKVDEVIGKLGL